MKKYRFLQISIVLFAAAFLMTLPAFAGGFAKKIEKAHGAKSWESQKAISADLVVHFGGATAIEGKMTTDTPVGQTRFELKDGTVLVFDGQDAWTAPADSSFQGTRFHVLTWPYFLAAPMKLNDPGAHLKKIGRLPLSEGRNLDAAHLSFGEGVGDSPDDWYIVYRDDQNRLAGMAYIVTFGKDVEAAEKEPHAITYHDYREVDGVMLPTRWQFWNWSREKGIFGDPIGDATLTNLEFVRPSADTFRKPQGARQEAAPAK